MKKILLLSITVGLLLVGCSKQTSESGNLASFDSTDIKSQIEKEDFNPELLTVIPFKVEDTGVAKDPFNKEHITIDFFGEGNHLSLAVFKGDFQIQDNEYEEIKIGDIKGKYKTNKANTKILHWKENGISYSLSYLAQQSKEEVTKEELIAVAESFK
ncbi:hypothetical protein GCM10009001_29500 [Virgibacillus siamensis]|uniref:DUF4367 domain-containing protein n=1 Tax=Virgibacillus siamensis TaxID=480071 RepID=A0ABN1GF85_9BACI